MAVCNIFKNLTNRTGSFLMFSQYVEDLTKNHAQGYQYRVVPSRFIACDIDYSVLGNDLNTLVPRFFQNRFENGCAAGRDQLDDWNPDYSKHIFWNSLINAKLIEAGGYMKQIMYQGDINLQSYDVKSGMGYSETYIHIPPQASKQKYECTYKESVKYLETTELIGRGGECAHTYYLDQSIDLGENAMEELYTDFDVNTIIVLYDVYSANELGIYKEEPDYVNIPMGVYFPGIFEDGKMTNVIHKFYSNQYVYGSGTSYSVRICTRMVANPEGDVINTTVEGLDDINMSEVLSKMSENLDKMMEISGNQIPAFDSYKFKQIMQQLQNSQTNVPYILDINGDPYWFVNGKNTGVRVPDGSKCVGCTDQDIEDMFDKFTLLATYMFDVFCCNREGEATFINYDKRFNHPLYISASVDPHEMLWGLRIKDTNSNINDYEFDENVLKMESKETGKGHCPLPEGDYEVWGLIAVEGQADLDYIPKSDKISVRRRWPIFYGVVDNNTLADMAKYFKEETDKILVSHSIYNKIDLYTGVVPKPEVADLQLGNNIIYMYPKSNDEHINQVINMSNMDDIYKDFETHEYTFVHNGEEIDYVLLYAENIPYDTFVSLEFNNEEKIIN